MADFSIPDAMKHRVIPSTFNDGDFSIPWIGDKPTLDERRQYMRDYLTWRLPYDDMEEREVRDLAERKAAMKLFNSGVTRCIVEHFEWLIDEQFWHGWLGHLGKTPPFPWPCPTEPDELTEFSESVDRWLDIYRREGDLVKAPKLGDSAPDAEHNPPGNETTAPAQNSIFKRSNEDDQLQNLSRQVGELRQELRRRDEQISLMERYIRLQETSILRERALNVDLSRRISERDRRIERQEIILQPLRDQSDLLRQQNDDLYFENQDLRRQHRDALQIWRLLRGVPE